MNFPNLVQHLFVFSGQTSVIQKKNAKIDQISGENSPGALFLAENHSFSLCGGAVPAPEKLRRRSPAI